MDEKWRNPDWDSVDRVHDWRNYAGPELRAVWDELPENHKRAVFLSLERVADAENWD